MAENNMSNNQTKHVNTRYHFVRELIEEGIIKIEFVKSENNDSDIFTKNLGKELFKKHSNKFMSIENDDARRTTRDGQSETDMINKNFSDEKQEGC
jgi:hypothetical protein